MCPVSTSHLAKLNRFSMTSTMPEAKHKLPHCSWYQQLICPRYTSSAWSAPCWGPDVHRDAESDREMSSTSAGTPRCSIRPRNVFHVSWNTEMQYQTGKCLPRQLEHWDGGDGLCCKSFRPACDDLFQRYRRKPLSKRKKVQTNAYLFIMTRTHSLQIFGKIPFVKPQNDT